MREDTRGWWEAQGKRGVRNLCKQQAQEGYGMFEVRPGYEVWKLGQWKKMEGRMPKEEEGKIRISVWLSSRALEEQMQDEDKQTALGRKMKKKVMRSMECFMSKAAVTEVYSPPRMAEVATARHLQAGSSIDL